MKDLLAGLPGEPSAVVRERVRSAREVMARRRQSHGRNAALTARELSRVAPLDAESRQLLLRASETFRITARGWIRIRRVARTIADLAGLAELRVGHVEEALQYRMPPGPR